MGLFSGGGSAKQRKKTRTFSDIKGKTDAEKYVDSHGDLTKAWNEMQSNPAGLQGSYWIQRMGGQFTKQAFGEAHRGESKLLFEGKYAGGTKVKKADPKFFSKKATMRTTGDEIGMRNPVGPRNVAATETETGTETSTTTNNTTDTTTTTQTNETTAQINSLTTALSNAIAAIAAISSGTSTTTAATSGETTIAQTWPGAPDWVKNFEDYRKWLRQKSASTGFISTIGTSTTGMSLDEYVENIKVTVLGS